MFHAQDTSRARENCVRPWHMRHYVSLLQAFDDFYDTLQRLEIQLVPHTK